MDVVQGPYHSNIRRPSKGEAQEEITRRNANDVEHGK
jgi:hypothetical protein